MRRIRSRSGSSRLELMLSKGRAPGGLYHPQKFLRIESAGSPPPVPGSKALVSRPVGSSGSGSTNQKEELMRDSRVRSARRLLGLALLLTSSLAATALASSHREAPGISN